MNVNDPEPRVKHGIVFGFECFMSVFYLAVGLVILLTKLLDYYFYNSGLKIAVGSLLAIYGIYRIFRSWNKFRDLNRTDDSNC